VSIIYVDLANSLLHRAKARDSVKSGDMKRA